MPGCAVLHGTAQTLVLNEVSNGPSGNKEYMELAVVPKDPCTDGPCLDIRGWTFDDNNGAFGPNGVAGGCGRFNTNSLWACVPMGTLIVIHNGDDPNPSMPPDDLSTTDGNCRIVVNAGDAAYLEYITTAVPSTDCTYPPGPWTTGDWSMCLLANPGDCARVTDDNGCGTSAVCYGSANTGTSIYFAGSGQRRVYFSSGDPTVQATWSYGCAGAAACGGDDQTPGAPNNAGNAAYLAPFSVCAGVVLPDPLLVTATSTPTCGCTGTAEATATGSAAPYTYAWYDTDWNALGQTAAAATDLCPGTYQVIVTSGPGCRDTATVTVDAVIGPALTLTSPHAAACGSPTGQACVEITGGTAPFAVLWDDASAQTTLCATALLAGEVSVTVTDDAGCTASGSVVVADSVPNVSVTATTTPAECGSASGEACATVVNGGGADWSFAWDDPAAQSTACATDLLPGDYTVTITDANGCEASTTVTVGNNEPTVTVSEATDITCAGLSDGAITLSLPDALHTLTWTGPDGPFAGGASLSDLAPGTYTYVWAEGTACERTGSITLTAPAAIGLSLIPTATLCSGHCDGSIDLVVDQGVAPFQYALEGDVQPAEPFVQVCAGTYDVQVTDANGCSASATVTVDEGPPGPVADLSPVEPLCVHAAPVTIEAVDPSGIWSGPGIADPDTGAFDPELAGTGAHWVVHEIAGPGCTDRDSVRVVVLPDPLASFFTTPAVPSELDASVLLIGNSVNAAEQAWTVGGTLLGSGNSITLDLVPGITRYPVCVIAQGLPGCADTLCQDVVLAPELRVHVPNSFSPDGDGINDLFGPVFSTPPQECLLQVFDRWGAVLFSANAYADAQWDGSGAPNDVFVWRLEFRDPNTLDRSKLIGHVTLLR